ncbi:hypothetical protein BDA99DRAFT_517845 [Phascolomyces articulosus]|uniref:F-box domain-containing protein n=1 Tax=Phascolomyces articulosus TaxID=60185 RepID=A0AAD5JUF5_9FUNG|nr:hypothetical protein BDA99DRAFT_517845 [Phascolomyces articulosus]
MLAPLPPRFLDTFESLPGQIQRVNQAFKNNDYQEIVEYASITIDWVYDQKLLLLALLDMRAYAFTMNGQYNEAYADAQKMVEIAPMSESSYVRGGHLLMRYGQLIDRHQSSYSKDNNNTETSRQQQIVPNTEILSKIEEASEINHNKIASEVSQQQQEQHEQEQIEPRTIKIDKIKESSKIELLPIKKIDPIQKFPDEVIINFLTLLPQNERLVYMQVSKIWRKRILDCADAWRDLSLGNKGANDFPLIRVANYLGDHVNHLRMNSDTHDSVRSPFIKSLQEGHFDRIQSLRLGIPPYGVRRMQEFVADVSIALYAIQNTLTHLDIDVQDNDNSITIGTILSACRNLTSLTYSTKNELLIHIGNFDTVYEHRYLVNLDLDAKLISRRAIDPIIRRCHRLRRINLTKCDISVLDILAQITTPYLEILGIHKDAKHYVPQLQAKKDIWREIGLRNLYIFANSSRAGSPWDILRIIQLIYKNRTTLQTIHVEIPKAAQIEIELLYARYPDLNFWKIERMTYFGPQRLFDQFLLQSIRDTSTLKILDLINLDNKDKLADTLITMSPLQQLNILGTSRGVVPAGIIGTRKSDSWLVKLFTRYTQLSIMSHTLESFSLGSQYEISDATLEVLAQLKTLKKIKFSFLPNVSTNGIASFFNKVGRQLNEVHLDFMDCVEDNILAILCEQGNSLSVIDLQFLKNVSNQGIMNLVDKAPSSLTELKIEFCNNITSKYCELLAKRTIKKVYFGYNDLSSYLEKPQASSPTSSLENAISTSISNDAPQSIATTLSIKPDGATSPPREIVSPLRPVLLSPSPPAPTSLPPWETGRKATLLNWWKSAVRR